MLNLPKIPDTRYYWILGFKILGFFTFTLLLFFGAAAGISPFTLTTKAACFPVNPQTGVCDVPLVTCTNDTTCCDNVSECSDRTASCSSDKPWERIPTCDVCGNVLFCSGNNYRLCTTDEPPFPPPAPGTRNDLGYINNPPSNVTFNGVSYAVPGGGLYFCDSNLYGCGNPSCKGGAVGGEGESRLWFPHIRLIAALSTIAQSLFNPKPSTLAKNTAPSNRSPSLDNPTVVTTRIEEHQGAQDGTTVVNTSDNNSSLIVGRDAPAPLYSFGNTSDDNPYNDSAQCRIDNTYTNPGDDLVGPKITGSLYYTQKYEYTAQSKPAGCIADGSPYPVNRSRECCSGIYQSNGLCGNLEGVRIPTKGKIALFVKNPLVEYIYNSLVAGSDSLFKRFMPGDKTQKFEEIGTPVTFSASATSANHEGSQTELAVGGDTSAAPTFYVPHLGSLKKYWLDDLQKALRPKTIGATTEVSTEVNCDKSAPDITLANMIDKSSAEDLAFRWINESGNQVANCYNDVVRKSINAENNPAFALLIWFNESNASNYEVSIQDFGINDPAVEHDFNKQITRFLGISTAYRSNYPECFNKELSDMEVFAYLFQTGKCNPGDASGQKYYEGLEAKWPLFSSCPFPSYPTDTRCP